MYVCPIINYDPAGSLIQLGGAFQYTHQSCNDFQIIILMFTTPLCFSFQNKHWIKSKCKFDKSSESEYFFILDHTQEIFITLTALKNLYLLTNIFKNYAFVIEEYWEKEQVVNLFNCQWPAYTNNEIDSRKKSRDQYVNFSCFLGATI